jgi:hypothetical protein
VALAALALSPACRRSRDTLLTYFDRRQMLSLRYPSSWSTELVEQPDNPSYRYFMAPRATAEGKPLSASLMVATPEGGVDGYAAELTREATITSTRAVERQGAKGKAYLYSKGADRYGLVLLAGEGRVHGLFVQGDEAGFKAYRGAIDEMMDSVTPERPAAYTEYKDDRFGYALRLPPSWRQGRKLSHAGTSMVQFLSPALGVDRDRSTIHASLVLTAEPFTGGLDRFYDATRHRLGEAFKVTGHDEWKGGYLDTERIETQVSQSRARRFYWASKERGYTLLFEAREDVFHRVSAWCDLIAGTFEVSK